jgi:hypothetical protein
MTCRARYVDGDVNLITVKADPPYPVEKGDLLYLHPATGCARPASALNAEGTQELDQLAFASYFLGVSNVKNGLQTGETTFRQDAAYSSTIQVCTTGRFEFDCPSQQFTPQQAVGVYSASGAGCSNQKVDALKGGATLSAMIGLAAPSEAALKNAVALDRVIVDIQARRPFSTAPAAGTYTNTSGV